MAYSGDTTDVTDSEWQLVAPCVPNPKTKGRRATIARRALLNALLYVTKTGCGWEWLPRDVPHWKTVYHSFRLWRRTGVWEAIHTALRERMRQTRGRNRQPRAAIIDRQSVKTTAVGGRDRGYAGGKKIKGRKRHLVVDTHGLILNVKVHAADSSDRNGAPLVLAGMAACFPRIRTLWTDRGSNGRFRAWAAAHLVNGDVEIVTHGWTGRRRRLVLPDGEPAPLPSGLHGLPKRWIVERTFAWLDQNRRLSKDDERLPTTSATFVSIAMSRLMIRRLAR